MAAAGRLPPQTCFSLVAGDAALVKLSLCKYQVGINMFVVARELQLFMRRTPSRSELQGRYHEVGTDYSFPTLRDTVYLQVPQHTKSMGLNCGRTASIIHKVSRYFFSTVLLSSKSAYIHLTTTSNSDS